MRKRLKQLMSLFLVISCSNSILTQAFAEPVNLSLFKQELRSYHDSGSYEKELLAIINKAHTYIKQQVAINQQQKKPKKLALVLDIDETSLSNYADIAKRDFITDHHRIIQEIKKAHAPAIQPMLSFYQDMLKNKVHIFFVTGRPQSQFKVTKLNLIRAGFRHWAGLYLRPDNYQGTSIIPFKSQTRCSITQQGYTIVASIGDQMSDFKGGCTQKGFKLPNPFYYIP